MTISSTAELQSCSHGRQPTREAAVSGADIVSMLTAAFGLAIGVGYLTPLGSCTVSNQIASIGWGGD